VEIDESDATRQTLLVWYPRVEASEATYVQAAVKIESGAKSALDPHRPLTIAPYINDDFDTFDLSVAGVTTIYDNTRAMIFGDAPNFDDILSSIGEIEDRLNAGR